MKFFRGWGKIAEFEDITDLNIIALDEHLAARGLKPYSKWNNYHRFLNSFILDAIDEGYVKRNPYKWVRIEKVKGMKVYIGTRAKTSQTFTIPLLKPALAILKKYNNHLPIISNVKYNEYLKVVAQNASIDKPVSSHWARHTGATLLLNSGDVPMNIVQHILGTRRVQRRIEEGIRGIRGDGTEDTLQVPL